MQLSLPIVDPTLLHPERYLRPCPSISHYHPEQQDMKGEIPEDDPLALIWGVTTVKPCENGVKWPQNLACCSLSISGDGSAKMGNCNLPQSASLRAWVGKTLIAHSVHPVWA
ncbi:Hypothetical predicted protein [Pelobates cultripes]|uniref:Uncharacterized protein n=1 Tax=Pelobates cultripes TaxID=61616 RepID=A0AAD1SUJ3_PELCU|nr:Hypothetical predicted protein [Pelobates cultripes]